MRIASHAFELRGQIPVEFAMGATDGFGGNRNPPLHWDDSPEGTRSFALLCIDTDSPTDLSIVVRDDLPASRQGIPVEQPRTHFVHWVMVDLPPDLREIKAGSCSDGITARGKRMPPGPAGARQGLNDYTGWFAGNATGISSACLRSTLNGFRYPPASPPPMSSPRCTATS